MWKGHKVEVAVLSSNVRVVSARDDPPSALAHHQLKRTRQRCEHCHHNVALAMMREGGRRKDRLFHIARGVFLSRRVSGRRPRVEGSCGS